MSACLNWKIFIEKIRISQEITVEHICSCLHFNISHQIEVAYLVKHGLKKHSNFMFSNAQVVNCLCSKFGICRNENFPAKRSRCTNLLGHARRRRGPRLSIANGPKISQHND
jgi:hypothetical protein